MTRLCIQGGHVIDKVTGQNAVADVWVDEGTIVSIGKAPSGFKAEQTLSAKGCIVSAGWVDLCTRFEKLAQLPDEMRAAIRSGITTLCIPPDVTPIIDNPAVAELIQHSSAKTGLSRIVPLGALTQGLKGKTLSSMAALKAAGCVGVSQGRAPLTDTRVLQHALAYAATLDLTVFLYPEDPWLADGGVVHEGSMSAHLGLPGIPAIAEVVAINTYIALAKITGARLHFCRLSTGAAVALIAQAQAEGLPITADVAIHQLYFTDRNIANFNEMYHVRPPLRSETDRTALREGVASGVISAICSDHTPRNVNATLAPFAATEPGMSALETFMPLGCQLVKEGVLDMSTFLDRVTTQPARILGIHAGKLIAGARADVCIFDPRANWTLTKDEMLSAGYNSPFVGQGLQGQVIATLAAGKKVT